jgi:hypothetical protein
MNLKESLRYRRAKFLVYPDHGVRPYYRPVAAKVPNSILCLLWLTSKQLFFV